METIFTDSRRNLVQIKKNYGSQMVKQKTIMSESLQKNYLLWWVELYVEKDPMANII